MNPHPLKQREQDLIQLYSYCQLGMTPKQFYSKWQVNYEEIAQISSRSLSTTHGGGFCLCSRDFQSPGAKVAPTLLSQSLISSL
ncbi:MULTISPECIES: hypothetical protein [unclassified Nostoc]|uniref:hypothetical protein n=1 Tax=unclassified Nostoc TaxID=2593658 RepID=UPI0026184751|nr:hypothetical protein [Nostoc sp. S13]MDF5738138.1 hypothetical protein [Nostoc sp. S13]